MSTVDDDLKPCLLEIDSRTICAGDEPPSRYAHEYEGAIRAMDEDYSPAETIGSFRVFVLDVESAVNERESIFDVFDWRAETLPFFEALYEEDASFNAAASRVLADECGGLWEPNILILDRLEIHPEFRRRRYGLQALQALMEEFRLGVGIMAMKPFPLQFEGGDPATRRSASQPASSRQVKGTFTSCRAKLRRYYSELGFRLVPKTDIMIRAADKPIPHVELRSRPGSSKG
jgi:GNAT superfamily N-acetyltransferase